MNLVYRAYGRDGSLLYVGYTSDLDGRMKAHRSSSAWYKEMADIRTKGFASRERAMAVEARAIRLLSPKFNRGGIRREELARREEVERAEREAAWERVRNGMIEWERVWNALTPEQQAEELKVLDRMEEAVLASRAEREAQEAKRKRTRRA